MNLAPRGAAADDKESIALRPSFFGVRKLSFRFYDLNPATQFGKNHRRISTTVIPTGGPRLLRAAVEGPWLDLYPTPTTEMIAALFLPSVKLSPCLLRKRPHTSSIFASTPSNLSTPSPSPKRESALPEDSSLIAPGPSIPSTANGSTANAHPPSTSSAPTTPPTSARSLSPSPVIAAKYQRAPSPSPTTPSPAAPPSSPLPRCNP